jgi:hypothetical protein
MAVRKKGRRKLTVGDRRFVWYVGLGRDAPVDVLLVISEDKHLIVWYQLGRADPTLLVKGRDFAGVPYADGCPRRFECPRWETGGAITPAAVRRLVDWCYSPTKVVVEVDWRGKRITHGG